MAENYFHIAPYEEKYFSQILELWSEQYDHDYIEKRKLLFKWITEENPFKNENATYFLLLEKERVVGMHGHMPLLFSISGQKQNCSIAHDDLLSMDYRGKGLGKIMLKGTIETSESFAGALWFNEPNYRLYLKGGWQDVPNLHSFVKIYNPDIFLEAKIKNQKLRKIIAVGLKKLLEFKRVVKSSNKIEEIKIIQIEMFNEAFDVLFDKISHRFGIMVERNHHYLNWKFVKKPFNIYQRFAAFDNLGELSGYMIIKVEKSGDSVRGNIIDFLFDPDQPEIFNAMIKNSCKQFEKDKVEYIQIISSSPLVSRLLKKNGFIRAKKPIRFMIKNWENLFEKDYVTNIENWYLTNCDGDGDAWTVDI